MDDVALFEAINNVLDELNSVKRAENCELRLEKLRECIAKLDDIIEYIDGH